MTDLMMNDNNNHYSDVFGDEIKNHRRKKSKGKTRDPRTDQSSSSPSKLDWATRVLFEIQSREVTGEGRSTLSTVES